MAGSESSGESFSSIFAEYFQETLDKRDLNSLSLLLENGMDPNTLHSTGQPALEFLLSSTPLTTADYHMAIALATYGANIQIPHSIDADLKESLILAHQVFLNPNVPKENFLWARVETPRKIPSIYTANEELYVCPQTIEEDLSYGDSLEAYTSAHQKFLKLNNDYLKTSTDEQKIELEKLNTLILPGTDIKKPNALVFAMIFEDVSLQQWLIEQHETDIYQEYRPGQTPLQYAESIGKADQLIAWHALQHPEKYTRSHKPHTLTPGAKEQLQKRALEELSLIQDEDTANVLDRYAQLLQPSQPSPLQKIQAYLGAIITSLQSGNFDKAVFFEQLQFLESAIEELKISKSQVKPSEFISKLNSCFKEIKKILEPLKQRGSSVIPRTALFINLSDIVYKKNSPTEPQEVEVRTSTEESNSSQIATTEPSFVKNKKFLVAIRHSLARYDLSHSEEYLNGTLALTKELKTTLKEMAQIDLKKADSAQVKDIVKRYGPLLRQHLGEDCYNPFHRKTASEKELLDMAKTRLLELAKQAAASGNTGALDKIKAHPIIAEHKNWHLFGKTSTQKTIAKIFADHSGLPIPEPHTEPGL